MKLATAIVIGLVCIFAIVSCVYDSQRKEMHDYARRFMLTAVDQPEQRFFSFGPFFYRDKNQTIWSMLVKDSSDRPAILWVRFSLIDDVYLVYPDGREIELK